MPMAHIMPTAHAMPMAASWLLHSLLSADAPPRAAGAGLAAWVSALHVKHPAENPGSWPSLSYVARLLVGLAPAFLLCYFSTLSFKNMFP